MVFKNMYLEACFPDGPTRHPGFCLLIVVPPPPNITHIFDYPAPETDHDAQRQTVPS